MDLYQYPEQLWQLEEADQAFKKKVSNYKKSFLSVHKV